MKLYARALKKMERELFPRVLKACGWNQSEAAENLGMSRNTFCKKIRAYGMKRPAGLKHTKRARFYSIKHR